MESEEDTYETNHGQIKTQTDDDVDNDIIKEDDLKPLLSKLIKTSRKKGEFRNVEERIMYNYRNGIGIHNVKTKTGKKLPPSVILTQGYA